MRRTIWFVVAGLIGVGSLVGAVLYILPRLSTAEAGLIKVVVPGNPMLALDKPGTYSIYHETNSTVDGRYYGSDKVDGLKLVLTSAATGAEVKLVEPKFGTSYKIGNREGTSLYDFTLDQPGRYRLAASLPGGREEPKVVLAIGRGFFGDLMGLIVDGVAIFLVGAGVTAAIVFIALRQAARAAKSSHR